MLCCRSTVCVYISFVYVQWLSNYSRHFNFTVFPKSLGIPGSWFRSISHLTFEETFIESYVLCLYVDFVAPKSKNSLCC